MIPHVRFFLAVAVMAGVACGRNEAPPKPFQPDLTPAQVQALAPPPRDAGVLLPSFGPVDQIKERFDRECPVSVPLRKPGSSPDDVGKRFSEWSWACTAQMLPGVTRTVDVVLQSGTSDNDRRLRKVLVICEWNGKRSKPPCDAIAEAVAYVQDATEMDERNANRLSATIRRSQPTEKDQWSRVAVSDRSVYFSAQLKDHSFGVILEADPSAWDKAYPIQIVDVELAEPLPAAP